MNAFLGAFPCKLYKSTAVVRRNFGFEGYQTETSPIAIFDARTRISDLKFVLKTTGLQGENGVDIDVMYAWSLQYHPPNDDDQIELRLLNLEESQLADPQLTVSSPLIINAGIPLFAMTDILYGRQWKNDFARGFFENGAPGPLETKVQGMLELSTISTTNFANPGVNEQGIIKGWMLGYCTWQCREDKVVVMSEDKIYVDPSTGKQVLFGAASGGSSYDM